MLETVFDEAFSLLEHLSKPIPASQRNNYPGVGDFEMRMRITNLLWSLSNMIAMTWRGHHKDDDARLVGEDDG